MTLNRKEEERRFCTEYRRESNFFKLLKYTDCDSCGEKEDVHSRKETTCENLARKKKKKKKKKQWQKTCLLHQIFLLWSHK